MRRIVLAAVIAAVVSAGPVAQQSRLTFEVASVKPQKAAPAVPPELAANLLRVLPGGTLNVPSITVQSLIEFAYNLKTYQIVGGPDWIRRDAFEVNARAPRPDATTDEVRLMVRALLEDRFGLTSRIDERDMRHYALVLSRASQLGPYLRHFEKDDCTPAVAKSARAALSRQVPQGARVEAASCMDAWVLASIAIRESGQPVVDETGLAGKVAFNLHYRSSGGATGTGAASDPGLPSFADAIEEQLGLTLEPREGPVNVLVIDSVQQPTEN